MEPAVVRVTLSLVGPGILVLFGGAFALIWLVERSRTYLLFTAAACLLAAIGAAVQVIYWPSDTGLNSMISGGFYTSAVVFAAAGIVQRCGRDIARPALFALWVLIMALLWYFFYIERSLIARIYVQNVGYSAILFLAALRISHIRKHGFVDKVLFWTLFLFALHFVPRTLLTIGFSAPVGEAAFANSLFWQTLQLALAILGPALAFAILAATISDLMRDLRRERDRDFLTGVLNRRGFETAAKAAWKRPGEAIGSLILCDVDHFKSINDTHGHPVGDVVLKQIAETLQKSARQQDVVGRVGGEEFAIFLPETNLPAAFEYAERLRLTIANSDFGKVLGDRRVSASFGVAAQAPHRWERLFRAADSCLYEAKRSGRNQTRSKDRSSVPNDELIGNEAPMLSSREHPSELRH